MVQQDFSIPRLRVVATVIGTHLDLPHGTTSGRLRRLRLSLVTSLLKVVNTLALEIAAGNSGRHLGATSV
jgi:hypothetical protein